ncbi:MAG: GNAT family N-acetyltransferase [Pirellulaceae bacterium]
MTFDPVEHPISIRIATSAESPKVQSIREYAFESVRAIYSPVGVSHITPVSVHENRVDAVASIGDADAGVMGIYSDGSILRVTGLGVLPAFRRCGIASALLGFAGQVAIERGCREVGLFTIRETDNLKVFLKLGFAVFHEEIADWCESNRFNTLHEVEMRRPVKPQPP